ncbi:hypothetical protein BDZ97DRAFT_1728058 [Flammula alnicola]|nr:hypothetical protein BDZ97DRAFT_1728058 [Flammula alnicola]
MSEFSGVAQRIRTLTTMLQAAGRSRSPSGNGKEVPSFLRHFATLACGGDEEFGEEAKQVIAVTGSSTAEGVHILVVTQNYFISSPLSELRVERLEKADKTFEQAVKEYDKEVTPKEHIADLWAIVANYNARDGDPIQKFGDFSLFIIGRSFRKLHEHVFQDVQSWKVNVYEVLRDWTPRKHEIHGICWMNRPEWVSDPKIVPDGMIERMLDGPEGQVQWELSNATVRAWVQFLAAAVANVRVSVKRAKAAKDAEKSKGPGEKQPEKMESALQCVTRCCYHLYRLVSWDAKVVQTLLTKTSLAKAFHLGFVPAVDGDVEPLADMRLGPTESEGQQVLRYLESIVAWHAAIMSFYHGNFRFQVPERLDIGLVEVPRGDDKIMSGKEISEEFFRRYPAATPEARATTQDTLQKFYPSRFTGNIHAEATLMGLLNCCSPRSRFVKYDIRIQNEDLLEKFIGPATFAKAIASSQKCCWCCNRLGNRLTDIRLPRSHGLIYAWSPPLVGIDISILRELENELWRELATALRDASRPTHCRHSSGSSTVGDKRDHNYVGMLESLDDLDDEASGQQFE